MEHFGHYQLRNLPKINVDPVRTRQINATDLGFALGLADKAATVLVYFQMEDHWLIEDLLIELAVNDNLDDQFAYDLIMALVELEELSYDTENQVVSW